MFLLSSPSTFPVTSCWPSSSLSPAAFVYLVDSMLSLVFSLLRLGAALSSGAGDSGITSRFSTSGDSFGPLWLSSLYEDREPKDVSISELSYSF